MSPGYQHHEHSLDCSEVLDSTNDVLFKGMVWNTSHMNHWGDFRVVSVLRRLTKLKHGN
ncbi:hypothetical protein DPMN_095702 [Dreissena polymorpha]|uniref:Uncharacterized protein n=1 Tax=Dreissena polymorpha TaxID=45954 RepID=A0A9D4L840_DREPO|nr:hypothetical protein DPMN_095702 [Dreissena polymorpha]